MTPSATRAFLARHGLLARRDLGQNFLVDEPLAAKLVRLAGVGASDAVLEIGTGLGILTRVLAARARRVLSLEVDSGLVRAVRAEGELPPHVEVRHVDALEVDLSGLVSELGSPVRVVANLPYSISSPLLRRLLDLRGELVDWSVTLQRELADRILSQPGTRDYGSLRVLHALTVHCRRHLELHPRCFYPVPRVASSFVRMTPLPTSPLRPGELAWVERLVRAGFSQRRKTLVNSLSSSFSPEMPADRTRAALEGLGIDPKARAESLDEAAWLDLARLLGSPDG